MQDTVLGLQIQTWVLALRDFIVEGGRGKILNT